MKSGRVVHASADPRRSIEERVRKGPVHAMDANAYAVKLFGDSIAANVFLLGYAYQLGCVPIGDGAGDFGGWFCPCHGSHYDTAGRIRRGPAPQNLIIPVASFEDETTIKLG